MYGRRGVLHLLLYCTCISPFSSPFVFYSWVRLFFLNCMAVYVSVVCMYCMCMCLCGMVVAWQVSRADCEGMGLACNCGDAELGEAITGQGVSYPNLSCRSQHPCFIDCIKQCIMVFPCFFITIWIDIMATGWQLRPVPSRVRVRIAAVERPPPWPNVRKCCSSPFFYSG